MPDAVERAGDDDGDPFASLRDPCLRLKLEQPEFPTSGPGEASLDEIKLIVEEDHLGNGLGGSWR
jgi:hypothetical protein